MSINREYSDRIRSLMPEKVAAKDPSTPVSMWKEMDRLEGKPDKTMVVIFRTGGCSWYNFSSCSMCGYFNDVARNVTIQDLKKQVDSVLDSLGDTHILKVFTSGSFLDPLEFPLEARDYFLSRISERVSSLLIESRTEYITDKNISGLGKYGPRIRIAIGLESANDEIIKNSINKGSNFEKYVKAAQEIKDLDLELRTYLLFKPPFLSEKRAIEDMIDSIRKVKGLGTDISVNPMNIQKNTMVEHLWKIGMYRLPSLYGLATILLKASKEGAQVVSYPTGGNKERGVHNEKPDPELLNLIYSCSLEQDFSKLEDYISSLNLTGYEKFLELEDRNLFQPDIVKMTKRISAGTFLN